MIARGIAISAAFLTTVAVHPLYAQDPPSPPDHQEAVAARVAVERTPRAERSERSDRESAVRAVSVRAPRTETSDATGEVAVRPRPEPGADRTAAFDEEQGGRRGGGGGNRGGGRVAGSGGAVPRQGGVRSPDADRVAGGPGQAVPRGRFDRRAAGGWGSSYGRRYYTGPNGLGYYFYDPWSWYGYGWPAYGAYGAWNAWGPGWGGGGYYGGGYYGGWGGGGWGFGGVRLRVNHRDAEVYVDGYYAGLVDDFDGVWQQLRLDDGGYRVEIRKRGFETLVFDVRIQPGRTITYRGELVPVP